MTAPSKVLNFYPHLALSDDDYAWLGAVIAYWALAEHQVEGLIADLAKIDETTGRQFTAKRIVSFDSKIDAAKKLLTLVCGTYPEHQQIGRLIMIKGKQLSKSRKQVAHWIPQRYADSQEHLSFVDLPHYPAIGTSVEHFSQERLEALTTEILCWGSDVGRFRLDLIFDGPLASRSIWHGPKPDSASLKWENFRTIQKMRPTEPNRA
jgi:hypothetical protein